MSRPYKRQLSQRQLVELGILMRMFNQVDGDAEELDERIIAFRYKYVTVQRKLLLTDHETPRPSTGYQIEAVAEEGDAIMFDARRLLGEMRSINSEIDELLGLNSLNATDPPVIDLTNSPGRRVRTKKKPPSKKSAKKSARDKENQSAAPLVDMSRFLSVDFHV